MKLHLISIVHRGVTYSGFFNFPEGTAPEITPNIMGSLGLTNLARGTTLTIG